VFLLAGYQKDMQNGLKNILIRIRQMNSKEMILIIMKEMKIFLETMKEMRMALKEMKEKKMVLVMKI
jgi:hypothetical protein